MPDRPGIDVEVTSSRPLGHHQHLEHRRADVAGAQHDALDVSLVEHFGSVGVVGHPQVGQPCLAGVAGRADEPDDADADLRVRAEQARQLHGAPVGADDDDAALEVAFLALAGQPRAVDRSPRDERDEPDGAPEEDLLDVEVQPDGAVEHDRPETEQDDGARQPGQLDRPDGDHAVHPEALAADRQQAHRGDGDHLHDQLEPGAQPHRGDPEDDEVVADEHGDRIADAEHDAQVLVA